MKTVGTIATFLVGVLLADRIVHATKCPIDEQLNANMKLVRDALEGVFSNQDASALDLFDPNYKQHNPLSKDGTDFLRSFLPMLNESKVEFGAQAARGDLVWTNARYTGIPGYPTFVALDVFRVENGKLVEHWDIIQTEVPASETASGRPMFPIEGAEDPEFPTPSSCADVATCEQVYEANMKLCRDALEGVFSNYDVAALDLFDPNYKQHNPLSKDGTEFLRSFIPMLNESKVEFGAQVARGDLVWTNARYTGIPGYPTFVALDVFRIANGKLVEHWDIIQTEVPASETASGRPMFPIQ